jgi:sulfite reductase (ferredoxin)
LKGRCFGECSAGIYDLPETDKVALEKALQGGRSPETLSLIRLLAARILLVTRDEDARDEQEVFLYFRKFFIDTGLIDHRFTPLLAGDAKIGVVKLAETV